jgi:hypothetical protein
MDRNLKTGLYMFGGLALATGLFFAVRAMIGPKKEDDDLTKSEREDLERLRQKEEDGTITDEEQKVLDDLENENTPGPDDVVLGNDSCGALIGNGTGGRSGCKQVAQIQTAINQKHNNNQADYKFGYCCTDSMIGSSTCDTKLAVDGVMGPCTSKAVKKYYDVCCSCDSNWYTLWINQVCNCTNCSINSGMFGTITAGADISEAKLCSEGYTKACTGTSSFNGYNASGDKYFWMPKGRGDRTACGQKNKFSRTACTIDANNSSAQGGQMKNAAGGIDQYEHDFGKTAAGNPFENINIKRAGQTTGGGDDCCTNPDICSSEQSCNGCKCMTTTRARTQGPRVHLPTGFERFGGHNASGPTRYLPPLMDRSSKEKDPTIFDPNDPDGQHRNFTLSDKEQLRGMPGIEGVGIEWRDQQGPLGDFYPGLFDFTNDNAKESNLEHSYGMGKGFGFDGTSEGEYIGVKGNNFTDGPGETGSETEIQTWDEFVNDVP